MNQVLPTQATAADVWSRAQALMAAPFGALATALGMLLLLQAGNWVVYYVGRCCGARSSRVRSVRYAVGGHHAADSRRLEAHARGRSINDGTLSAAVAAAFFFTPAALRAAFGLFGCVDVAWGAVLGW